MYHDDIQRLDLESKDGALIETVTRGTPAHSAGIRPGDVITDWNGIPIKNHISLFRHVGMTLPDTTAEVTLVRNGEVKKLEVSLVPKDDFDSPMTFRSTPNRRGPGRR